MRLSHTRPVTAATFDEPNLVSAAGVVPVLRLAQDGGLGRLAGELLTVPSDKGADAGGKVTALAAGADSIDDMTVLRHGAMRRLFDQPYAPSTLGSFLRAFAFGHVRQLDAVASLGYNKVRGLNVLLATVTTSLSAPVIIAQRLRKGSASSARGARWLAARCPGCGPVVAPGRGR